MEILFGDGVLVASVLAIFFIGACLGSFINVMVLDYIAAFKKYGLEEKNEFVFAAAQLGKKKFWQGFLSRRSRCDHCRRDLGPLELVPFFSYLFQAGRCRACKKPIDGSHFWVELVLGLYLVGLVYAVGAFGSMASLASLGFLFWLFVFLLLFFVALFDLRTQIIPDLAVMPVAGTLLVWLGYLVSTGSAAVPHFLEHLAAGVVFFGLFWLVWYGSAGQWIGYADAKLAFIAGLLFGFSAGFTALAVAFWAGAVLSLTQLSVERLSGRPESRQVPFGPYLVFGTWFVFVSGINLFSVTI